MNYSIKFKAWNSKSKKMFTAEEMANDQMCLLPTGNFINVHNTKELSVIYSHSSMLPLQYTGLNDKNGDEIYQDDILEDLNGVRGVIKYSEYAPSFVLVEDGEELGILNAIVSGMKVVGNVHENPELKEKLTKHKYE